MQLYDFNYILELLSLIQLENLDSALYQLKSALNRTNNDLAELNDTKTKVKSFLHSHTQVASYNTMARMAVDCK